jgi:hypothetical protein
VPNLGWVERQLRAVKISSGESIYLHGVDAETSGHFQHDIRYSGANSCEPIESEKLFSIPVVLPDVSVISLVGKPTVIGDMGSRPIVESLRNQSFLQQAIRGWVLIR